MATQAAVAMGWAKAMVYNLGSAGSRDGGGLKSDITEVMSSSLQCLHHWCGEALGVQDLYWLK